MTPAEAADDGVTLGREACHSGGVDSVNVGLECVFGDPGGAVTIALLARSYRDEGMVVGPDGGVPSCLSERPDQPDQPERCAIDLSTRAGLDALLNGAEREAATDRVVFLDLTDLVCPGDPCQVVTPIGTIIHRDAHHLTQTYSQQLGPGLVEHLAPIVAEAVGD